MIKTIRNAMKIRDMAKCLEEFEQLCRAFLKSKAIVDKEGVPQFYVRLLADLEDYLNQVRVITKDTSLYLKKKKKKPPMKAALISQRFLGNILVTFVLRV